MIIMQAPAIWPGAFGLGWVFFFFLFDYGLISVKSSFSISQMKFFDWHDFPVHGLGCPGPGPVPPDVTDDSSLRPRRTYADNTGMEACLTVPRGGSEAITMD